MEFTIENIQLSVRAEEYSNLKWGYDNKNQSNFEQSVIDFKAGYLAALEDINTNTSFKINP